MSQFFQSASASAPPVTVVQTLTANDASVATASANNINLLGNNTANNGYATYAANASGNTFRAYSYGPYKWIVNPIAGVGTHQTIAAAVTASSSGDSIFITPGTYTENIVAPHSLNLIGADVYIFDQSIPAVTIIGKISNSAIGADVSLTNIRLQTNGDFVAALSGSSASTIFLKNCFLQASNFSLLSATNSSVSSSLTLQGCSGNFLTTGINLFTHTTGNLLNIFNTYMQNGGSTTTANTSTGIVLIDDCNIPNPITMNTAGSLTLTNSQTGAINTNNTSSATIDSCVTGAITQADTSVVNAVNCSLGIITCSTGTGTIVSNSIVTGGVSTAISIGSGCIVTLSNSVINSSNTNVVSGGGTFKFTNIGFIGTSANIASTTQTPLTRSNDLVKVTVPGAYPYTVLPQDAFIPVDSSSARTINLPASPGTGQSVKIKDDAALAQTNNITVSGNGKNIDGSSSVLINLNGGSFTFTYNGTQWNRT